MLAQHCDTLLRRPQLGTEQLQDALTDAVSNYTIYEVLGTRQAQPTFL